MRAETLMGLPLIQVDAFTDRPFSGNPAAVCILEEAADPTWMQEVAREMNLSETAFLVPRSDGDGFNLRWFTPTVEVALCGHATLASAHVLWEEGVLPPDELARFHTKSGLLTAERGTNDIEMDFPAILAAPAAAPPALLDALGLSTHQIVWIGKSAFDYLVEVDSEDTVRRLTPDLGAARGIASLPVRGVIVAALAVSPGFDFVSRFFAPSVGVPEDPVTGSAHSCLAPHFGARLGKAAMLAYQASARGGVVRVRLAGPRVIIGGQAVTVMRGELVC